MRIAATCLAVLMLASAGAVQAAEPAPVFVGHKYKASYPGGPQFLLDFKSVTYMEATFLAGPSKGQVLKINFTAKEVAPSVYLLTWQEEDKTTVVHVDDFSKLVSYSNATLPDKTFQTHVGRLSTAD